MVFYLFGHRTDPESSEMYWDEERVEQESDEARPRSLQMPMSRQREEAAEGDSMITKNEYVVAGPIGSQALKWQVLLVKPPRSIKTADKRKKRNPHKELFSRAEVVAQFRDEELAIQFSKTWNGDTNQ